MNKLEWGSPIWLGSGAQNVLTETGGAELIQPDEELVLGRWSSNMDLLIR